MFWFAGSLTLLETIPEEVNVEVANCPTIWNSGQQQIWTLFFWSTLLWNDNLQDLHSTSTILYTRHIYGNFTDINGQSHRSDTVHILIYMCTVEQPYLWSLRGQLKFHQIPLVVKQGPSTSRVIFELRNWEICNMHTPI